MGIVLSLFEKKIVSEVSGCRAYDYGWTSHWQHRQEINSNNLGLEKDVGATLKKDECFAFEITVSTNLKCETTALEDGLIKASVEIENVQCTTGRLEYSCRESGRASDIVPADRQHPSVDNYRNLPRAINVSLTTSPGIGRGLVKVVPQKSTHNPEWDENQEFSQIVSGGAGVTATGNPYMRVGLKERTFMQRLCRRKCWNLELVRNCRHGFFWRCKLDADLVQPSREKSYWWRSRLRDWYRSAKRTMKRSQRKPWMDLIDPSSTSTDVNFGGDEYPQKIDYFFDKNLRNSMVSWTVKVEIPIVCLKISKRCSGNPRIIEGVETVVERTYEFEQKLSVPLPCRSSRGGDKQAECHAGSCA